MRLNGVPATKSQVLLWIGSAIALMTVAGWKVLEGHTSVPHPVSLPRIQFEQYASTQQEWRNEQRAQINELKTYIMAMQGKQDEYAQETHALLLRLLNRE